MPGDGRAPQRPGTDGWMDRWMDGWRRREPGRDEGGREAKRKGWGERREREGRGRIDSLSSTGTTELSCHGERGAAGRARGGRRNLMPEGRRQLRANPHTSGAASPEPGLLGRGGQAGRGTGPTQWGRQQLSAHWEEMGVRGQEAQGFLAWFTALHHPEISCAPHLTPCRLPG